MLHLAVIQLMPVLKWLRSDSDGSCVNKNVRGNKGFYSTMPLPTCCNRNYCKFPTEIVGIIFDCAA